MTGGLKVRSREVAAEATVVFGRLDVPGGKPVRVGERLKEPPCMSADDLANPKSSWQQAGRPCPRVDLRSRREHAIANLAMLIHRGSDQVVPLLLTHRQRRRRRLYDGAIAVLSAPRVVAAVKRIREQERQAAEGAKKRGRDVARGAQG